MPELGITTFVWALVGLAVSALLLQPPSNDDDDSHPGGGLMQPVA